MLPVPTMAKRMGEVTGCFSANGVRWRVDSVKIQRMQNPLVSNAEQSDPRFNHQNYVITKKLLQAFGGTFYLYDPNENLVLWASQKAFKLKEDFRIYSDENKTQELIRVGARSILDFSAAYDVFDSATGQKIGAFKRQGLKSSFVQDTWTLMDWNDAEIGLCQEDSAVMGVVRRFVGYANLLMPQRYDIIVGGQQIATFQQGRNPWSSRMEITFNLPNPAYDRRLVLALAMLLSAIEGKQR